MWVFQEIIDNGMPISAELYGCRAVRAKGILCGALFTSTVILNGFASCFVSNDNHNVCGVNVINNLYSKVTILFASKQILSKENAIIFA